jgi:hypothetical protein
MILNSSIRYPIFKKGDALKSDDLNNLINYLEGEELDTRVFLIGAGIFYGLELSWNEGEKRLEITNGAGVSSDGYLFALNLTDENGTPQALAFNAIGDPVTNPFPGTDNTIQANLLTTSASPNNDLRDRLNANDVILFRLKVTQTTVEDCLRSYENSGTRQDLSIEVMIISQRALTEAAKEWLVALPGSITGEDPHMHRFGYQAAAQEENAIISFANFTSWQNVKDNFDDLCEAAETAIADDYKAVYANYAAFLGVGNPNNNPFNGMAAALAAARAQIAADTGARSWQLPYYYDYLKDLISAYREFTLAGFNTLYLPPDKTRFEKYLSLGSCPVSQGTPAYRMALYRPPFADADKSTLERLKLLLQRMVHIADINNNTLFKQGGALPAVTGITPSAALPAALSKKALPFYYTDRAKLKTLWNYELQQQQRGYYQPGVDAATDKKLLLRDMDAYSFFRTQGYIGKTAKDANDQLEIIREQLHLPFDIKLVFLGSDDMAADLLQGETAWFSDLGLLLEKVVGDIRCGAECGDNYEDAIFEGSSTNMNIGEMFEALGRFFEDVTTANWAAWVRNKCAEICNPQLPGLAAAPSGSSSCCPMHLKILFDLYIEYSRRKKEVLDELFFHKFAAKHPGLEHNAGVPKGGTLVLVCAAASQDSGQKEIFAAMLRNLKSLNESAKATLLLEAESLSDYIVVADFCLPYICCSKTPSVKIELQQVQPEADFETVGQAVELPEGAGKRFKFHNLSRNANHFKWELFDHESNLKATRETGNVAEDVEFDMFYTDGVQYLLRLTASRGPLFQQVAKAISFCPKKEDLELDHNGKESFIWKKDSEIVDLILNVKPYGGEFNVFISTGGNEWEPVSEDYTIVWQSDKRSINFIYDELPIGTYRLEYSFSECDVSTNFGIRIDEGDAVLTDSQLVADIKTVYNKRMQQYRKAVSAIGDEDKTLGKTEKFGKTEAFLRFSGKQPELHSRFADLLKSLQTGMANAGEKRQQQVADLTAYSTLFYLDRLLANNPDAVQEEAKPLLQEAAGIIKGRTDGLKQLQEIWDAAAVTNDQNSAAIAAYKALLA